MGSEESADMRPKRRPDQTPEVGIRIGRAIAVSHWANDLAESGVIDRLTAAPSRPRGGLPLGGEGKEDVTRVKGNRQAAT